MDEWLDRAAIAALVIGIICSIALLVLSITLLVSVLVWIADG